MCEITSKIHDLAKLLDCGIEFDRDMISEKLLNDAATLTLPTGEKFRIRANGWRNDGKFKIIPKYPYNNDCGYISPKDCLSLTWDQRQEWRDCDISVSTSKTAETIAKEINRRFMPEFLVNYAAVKAYTDRQKQYADKQRQTTEKAAKILGGKISDRGIYSVELERIDSVNISGDKILLHLRLSISDLEKVAQAIGLKREH